MKVSVCMATYNGERFISEQIRSILPQLKPDDELIISDDGSLDATVKIVEGFDDPRIKLLSSNNFRNPIKNFENALNHVTGEVIFLSDQDDIWLEGKYKETIVLLEKYDLVVSDSMVTDEQLNVINHSFFDFFNSSPGLLRNIIKSCYYGSCMAFRRSVIDLALPLPQTKEIGHDLWIGLVAEMTGAVYFYKKPLLLYRRHTQAFTPVNVKKSERSYLRMLIGRLVMLREIIKFYIKYKLKWKKA